MNNYVMTKLNNKFDERMGYVNIKNVFAVLFLLFQEGKKSTFVLSFNCEYIRN